MSSYAQYLMPLIMLQAIAFAAVSAAFRSATDSVQGINRRFESMPIAPLTPLASRMSASMYRCLIALAVSLVCGHVIGFRFYGGVAHTVGFCVLALLIGAALSLLGDLIGAANKNPEATMPIMLVPQLVFGLLSVGLQPVERFPEWIQPFVRNQPISQFVYALRALAGDSTPAAGEVTWSVIGPALAWIVGMMVIVIPLHARVVLKAAMMSLTFEDSQLAAIPSTSYRQGRHRRTGPTSENAWRRLVPHTWVLTNRILRRWSRDPATVLESLVIPIVLLVTLNIVLGDAISQVTGHSALYGSVPLVAMVGAMTGAMVGGIGLMGERTDGLLSRLWVLPVHRASGLLSRLAADAVRIVVTHRGHPVRRAACWVSGSGRESWSRWRGCSSRLCSGLAFSVIVITHRVVRGEHDHGGGHRGHLGSC